MQPAAAIRETTLACVLLLGCAGCSESPADLFVEVRTDVVAGIELTAIQVERFDASPEPLDGASGSDRQVASVAAGDDLSEGVRAAVFVGLEPGTHAIRVRLLSGADVVLERVVIVDVQTNMGITVVLSRSCGPVVCPGADDPLATQCRAGACVTPTCSTVAPEACPAPECGSDAECGAGPSCTRGVCADGACLVAIDDSLCADDQTCHPVDGCVGGRGYVAEVMADGPMAYWRFGEAAGAPTAVDATGNGFTGAFSSGVMLGERGAICGDSDTAARFDGGRSRRHGGRLGLPRVGPLQPRGVGEDRRLRQLRDTRKERPGAGWRRGGTGSSCTRPIQGFGA